MKKYALILALAGALGTVPVRGQAAVCPPPPRVQIRVQLIDPPPRIMRTKSLNQINASANTHGLVGQGKRALGITESELEASLNIKFVGQRQVLGQAVTTCLNVKSINARFGHRKLQVNLPREYPRGSCKYKVVYRHEMAHVAVARRTLRKYAILLRAALERAVQQSNPMRVRTMKLGAAAYQKRLQAVMTAIGKQFEVAANAQHAQIDAPGSPYAATGACQGW